MTITLCALSGIGGFALCWFIKDTLIMEFTSTAAFVAKLEAKARALRAAL